MAYGTRNFVGALDRRMGPKAYAFCIIVGMLALFLPKGAGLGIATVVVGLVCRLNDIGWRRWHAIWMAGLLFVWYLAFRGLLGIDDTGQDIVAAVIKWPILLFLILLLFFPGQKNANAYGAKPVGYDAIFRLRDSERAYQSADERGKAEVEYLIGRVQEKADEVTYLSDSYRTGLETRSEDTVVPNILVPSPELAQILAAREELAELRQQLRLATAKLVPVSTEYQPYIDFRLIQRNTP